MKADFPMETVSIGHLDLDLRNSRFPRDAQSQGDALELMLATSGQECLQLLRDLTRTGQMNSAEPLIVVQKGSRYVVMEGNRRLTCLQIWGDVDLLSTLGEVSDDYQARATRYIAASLFEAPKSLRVAIAPAEADADHWIERKHTGGSGGTGTVEWGAAMKDRRKARNHPERASRAISFIEKVAAEFEEDHALLADLETVRTTRYTMISRFVDRGIVRERLGLSFDKGKMTFDHGSEATHNIVRAVMHDFAQPKAASGKTWARELDTVADFEDYLDQYADLLPTAQDGSGASGGDRRASSSSDNAAQGHHTDGTNRSASSSAAGSSSDESDPRPPRPTPPKRHIFRGLVLDRFTNRIQEIVRETSLLDVTRQTEIAAVLLRVILDLTTYQFLTSHGAEADRHLDRRIKNAIRRLEPKASDALGEAESTSPLRKAYHATTADNIRLVQYAVHDITSAQTPNEVLTLADRYYKLLVAMNENMGDNPTS